MKFVYFEEIDSTNSYLKREYEHLDDMTLVSAGHQFAGKGRLGRKWEDDSSSLVFSILLKENLNEDRISLLPLLCGVSLLTTLEDYSIPSLIKWPNDVIIEGKKCAGILLEAVYEDEIKALIIGIGINVNTKEFPKELKSKAISLFQYSKKEYDKEEVLHRFIHHFEKFYLDYQKKKDTFLSILKECSYLDQKEITLNYYGENKHVKALGILDDGSLQVKEGDKVYSVSSGEATLEKNYEEYPNQKL